MRTERLVLRPWTTADAATVLDIYSRWDVQRYIGVEPRVMADLDEALARIERWRGYDDGVRAVWAIEHGGRAVGSVLLKRIPWSADTEEAAAGAEEDTEIGWHLHPEAWGHGVATEAATAVLEHARRAGLQRIVAVTNPENTASQRVALRVGMTALGRTRRYYDTDCELFELTL